ncbi:hypothetical protein PAEAM_00860 [Paenibacillus sp. GM1FR]|uniref:hypothetical protein n=1 Tax=Paenibacillus sp. GM1FR TaxID=2059267 RepID=UPI000C27DBCF|nr:hypothetical protein [Paenibacillus sp. GM1FR]PJN66443.1 hypothetical protein PAEAM_00860 [Paenibacillus sp. GM1FR]
MRKGKVLFSFSLTTLIFFSSVTGAFASTSEVQSIPDKLPVPEGYEIIQDFKPKQESGDGNLKIEAEVSASPMNFGIQSTVAEDYDYKIIESTTQHYQDSINFKTNDTLSQYRTDVTLAAVNRQMGGNVSDANQLVKVTVTTFYHEVTKGLQTFVGLDKVYYRYDKGNKYDSSKVFYGNQFGGELVQTGPGINGRAVNERDALIHVIEKITLGKTYLRQPFPNVDEVLVGGLFMEMGVKTQSRWYDHNTNLLFNLNLNTLIQGRITP